MKIYQILLLCTCPLFLAAQKETPVGGQFSLGQRSTFSAFNSGDNERPAIGVGGQFRIRLSERINTEWFFDYLPASNAYTRRKDFHIGWSVFYYPISPVEKKVVPYILAGHCFDYTHHLELANRSNEINRLSSAAQMGIGSHFNLTNRFDFSLSAQYMIHLGTDVHSHMHDGEVHFEREKGGKLEGHLLFTASLNYRIADLWSRKEVGRGSIDPNRREVVIPLSEGGRRGILQGTATLYPSWMLNHGVRNNYVGGHLAYYFDDDYSFRGDFLAYTGAQTTAEYLRSHVQLMAGFGRHFPVKRLDPYIYLQGGLAAVQILGSTESYMQPLAGMTVGLNYHVAPWFYFFGEVAYNRMQDPSGPGNMDQLYTGAGLGFQVQTRKG